METKKESEPKKFEHLMKPLRELVDVEMFRSYGGSTSWYVSLEWSEPQSDMTWKKFDAVGELNQRFLDWAEKHYEHWFEKGHVPLKIKKIEYIPDYHGEVGW